MRSAESVPVGFGDPGFEDSGFGDPGFGDSGFGDPGFGDSGFGGPGYGSPGFDAPGFGDTGLGLFAGGMGIAFVVFGILFVGALIVAIVVSVRKYRVLKDAGVDPTTVDAAIAAKLLTSDLSAPRDAASPDRRSLEQRLAELDDLHARGVITADEHRDARAAALRG
ncbi:SHOCT domain-containing protein [Microbacterium sp. 179-B 1A2 NHS]|uniref:SHOCT domain-containing protein n=1 Tax=Microbacterium sp. 179-B 1A2 NHS TaxID=3142383 RepID=UPI0039A157EE